MKLPSAKQEIHIKVEKGQPLQLFVSCINQTTQQTQLERQTQLESWLSHPDPELRYILDPVLSLPGSAELYGPTGAGKTWLATGLAVAVEWCEEVLPKSYEAELVEDMLSLLSSFSAKIYGRRSAERRKKKTDGNF